MAVITLTLTANNAGAVSRLGKAIQRGAANWDDNRAVGTFTVADNDSNAAPWTVTYTTNSGQVVTEKIG